MAARRRIGTDHLLIALVRESGAAATALGVLAAEARAASTALDRAALDALGIEMPALEAGALVPGRRRMLPLTSGARAALAAALERARHLNVGLVEALLDALLALALPDPAAALLGALGTDRAVVLARLRAGKGGAA